MNILAVIGTRPEAVKMAPVVRELVRRGAPFRVEVCLSAQHRDLLDPVIRLFDVPVHYDLDVMRPDQSIFDVFCAVLTGMKGVIERARPDVVLVHGDTSTSFAAALAAYYLHVRVGHVEAGLRTYDKYRPFPEEMNRRFTDAVCDYHYAPTPRARDNLLRERVAADHILVTGNTVIDALLDVAARPYAFDEPRLETFGKGRRLLLVTAHRRESFGAPFREMCRAMRDLARDNADLDVVYPVHPNPNVRAVTREMLEGRERVHCIEPLEYLPFVQLMKKAAIVLTDSGGIQEEAPSLGKPVLVMREVTERPEAVEAGTARLVGSDYETIVRETQRLLDDPAAYAAMATAVNPYGDGRATPRIADHLATLA
ncbi:MAG TPA: UDP-N-acetylglucosamine 2-epimerase (non-hydrolyzing) [Candidatus Hydrogenedentes bacterium]|nr:UDP-N-acetylglucosamine 2-epimerase (non-hydrolyzing) [Candidatus Hydrogenedentota bacterium]HNT88886.1 UDP-N-acetylglucosamine 2-epimerase (non-hydrolyzing) [Candidatus Hydrogenedentota bacterium]